MLARRLRLWSGLTLAVFVTLHLLNHMLGLLSLTALERLREVLHAIWFSLPGTLLLYGALLTHWLLALWSLYRRDHLRLKRWEALQLGSGLLIPVLLLGHLLGTRGRGELFGFEVTYPQIVATLWFDVSLGIQQTIALLLVWAHLLVGLHFWLRLKPWYPRWLPWLYPLAVLWPLLALLGFVRAGLDVQALAATPGWTAQLFAPLQLDAGQTAVQAAVQQGLWLGIAGLLALTLLARELRRIHRNRSGVFRLVYPSGQTVQSHVGATLLEAVRRAGLPHAAVCGGRGRCTTCRVRVGVGQEHLEPPNETEQRALRRIDAPPGVRLACQVRPRHDLAITPLVMATAALPTVRDRRSGFQGREQTVVVMFLDLRGSTSLAERLLPYDVVFILNQFFAEMAVALKQSGGRFTQFTGDGFMALYGLNTDLATGCRQALAGAVAMQQRLEALNRSLKPELGRDLRMGIGIHCGEAIVGDMGPPDDPAFSAIGDTVNTAARLEALNKDYESVLVVSAAVAEAAGVDLSAFPQHTVTVRGRSEALLVYALAEVDAVPAPA